MIRSDFRHLAHSSALNKIKGPNSWMRSLWTLIKHKLIVTHSKDVAKYLVTPSRQMSWPQSPGISSTFHWLPPFSVRSQNSSSSGRSRLNVTNIRICRYKCFRKYTLYSLYYIIYTATYHKLNLLWMFIRLVSCWVTAVMPKLCLRWVRKQRTVRRVTMATYFSIQLPELVKTVSYTFSSGRSDATSTIM